VGQSGYVAGVLGTTEANGVLHTVTAVVDRQYFDTDVNFVNAYTSGGRFYEFNAMHKIYDESTGEIAPDGHIAIGTHLSNTLGCVVQIYNGSVGGSTIEQHNQLTSANGINLYGLSTLLAFRAMGKIGCFLWRHGHANIGQTTYFSDSGTDGAWVGYGEVGTLIDMYRNNVPNSSSMKFGFVPFPLVTGRAATDAANTHRFRWGMDDLVVRKNAAGDLNCFKAGWIIDLPAQWENGTPQNSHKPPPTYIIEAARMAQCVAKAYGASAYDGNGPILTNGSRSGAVLTLPVTQNGGSSLRVLTSGAMPSGFTCSTDPAFGSSLTINDVQISGNNVVITLSADPGATVYTRYMWGQPGPWLNNDYMTFRVTGAADNGSGLIRLKCEVSPTPALVPVSSQPAGGLTAYNGKWGRVQDVKGATQANGTWLMTVIDSETVDLVGSSSAGLGTFVAGENLWQTSATGLIAFDTAVPIYDDRTIGTYDPNGAPIRPLYTYVTAS